MLGLLKKVIKGEVSPVELIQGENKPTLILVDLICTKILLNLDNIDFKHEEPTLTGSREGNTQFTWKVDDIIVAASKTLCVKMVSLGHGDYRYDREYKKDYFSIKPQIKINGNKHVLTEAEEERLWETMLKAGKMKQERDKERAEYNRQRLAVEAIASMGNRESDIVKKARELSEQALLRLQAPELPKEEELLARFGES